MLTRARATSLAVNIYFSANEAARASRERERDDWMKSTLSTRGSSLPGGREVTLRNGVGKRRKYCAGGISVLRGC